MHIGTSYLNVIQIIISVVLVAETNVQDVCIEPENISCAISVVAIRIYYGKSLDTLFS